ncbi:hypothetical protein ACOIP5_003104 [Salmonella enterica]|nr:hypothetical protein [Salmonella enterica subsp. enterica serovar Bareilly]
MEKSVDWSLIIDELKCSGMTVKEISFASRLPRSVINALAHGHVGLYPEGAEKLMAVYRNINRKSGR